MFLTIFRNSKNMNVEYLILFFVSFNFIKRLFIKYTEYTEITLEIVNMEHILEHSFMSLLIQCVISFYLN